MYRPTLPIPTSADGIPAYLSTELQALSQALGFAQELLFLKTLNVAPTKPREGMVVKADGTNWNPGSGAALYVYLGGAWVAIGSGGGGGTVKHTVGALVNHALTAGSGVSVDDIKSLALLTDGQLMVGATGADPAPQTMSGDATVSSLGVLTLKTGWQEPAQHTLLGGL